jgi:hypothetical protein
MAAHLLPHTVRSCVSFVALLGAVVFQGPTASMGESRSGSGDGKEKPLPQTGVLASGGASVGVRGGATALSGDIPLEGHAAEMPLGASLKRISPQEWGLVLTNASPHTVSVSVLVTQKDFQGLKVKSDMVSASLSGNSKVERRVSASPMSANCIVELRGAKITKRAKPTPTPSSGGN